MQAENAKQATQALHHVRGTTGRATAQRAIDAYHAEKGVYPPSIDTLVAEGYLAAPPALADGTPLGYDPDTGQLLEPGATPRPSTTQPAPPAGPGAGADDQQKLAAVQQALREYRLDNGAYPSSLYALVPTYLEMLPTPAGGHDFAYDPATGSVSLPGTAPSARQAQPRQRQGYGTGTTPMVENMTGLGAQQELNRMGHGGTNQAGARSRQRGQSIPDQHTQRQMETMDELGL
jgi:hypothetical protein